MGIYIICIVFNWMHVIIKKHKYNWKSSQNLDEFSDTKYILEFGTTHFNVEELCSNYVVLKCYLFLLVLRDVTLK